jgi:hypothetical protein
MHVRQQAIVLHELRRGTGALGVVLSVRCGRADGHVIIVPLARSRDVLVQLVFALVEGEAKGGQLITRHELLHRSSGLWGDEIVRHVPGDPVPLGTLRMDISTHSAQQQGCNQECREAAPADWYTHLFLLKRESPPQLSWLALAQSGTAQETLPYATGIECS